MLTYQVSYQAEPAPADPSQLLENASRFWRDWSGRCEEAGPYSAAVSRSLITLKALTFRPSGGIVAVATTSLPEQIGGPRNWDYRFCWLRDATLTLLTLMGAGYCEEALAWRDRLLRAVRSAPDHVCRLGRAKAYGMGSAVAGRLRKVQARAHRQCRAFPAAA